MSSRDELRERLQEMLDASSAFTVTDRCVTTLRMAIAALSPVLPEEVKPIWSYLRANNQTDAADLIERLAISDALGRAVIEEQKAHIEELEHELNDARSGRLPT